MGKPTGFLEHSRQEVGHRPVDERTRDYREVVVPLDEEAIRIQAARCMDCGVPFCHGLGCPLGNRIPEWNDLVYRGRWKEACENLHSTNNFPEFTGRICPALCESACTLSINDSPTLIRHIEYQIVERGWREGWIVPLPPRRRTGRKVAVVGSGPAGLSAAQQLARAGHSVTVFEKADRVGGLLRFGIPDFKLDKGIIDRRLRQMSAEGVEFQTSVVVGEDISPKYLKLNFDAIVLAIGSGEPRDLAVPGRGLDNVLFAMDYLSMSNRIVSGLEPSPARPMAKDLTVAVIGGGDTGSDCVGTARRQGAREIHQFEIMPPPPVTNPQTPWPMYSKILRTSTSHEEGCVRHWGIMTKQLAGSNVRVERLTGVKVEWSPSQMREIPGSEFTMNVDLVLIAMGFVHPVHAGLVTSMGVALDDRGNVRTGLDHMTSVDGVFAAGDATRGASLVVHAIASGIEVAAHVNRWLE